MKTLTEAEHAALKDLLYLVTHDEGVNTAILSSYRTLRVGNTGMVNSTDFAALLESLHAKSCT